MAAVRDLRRHDRRLDRPAALRRRGRVPGRVRDRGDRDHDPGGFAPRLRRPDRVVGPVRVFHRARRAENRTRTSHRVRVHPRAGQAVTRSLVCAREHRRAPGDHRAVEQRARRWHRFPRRAQPRRGVRLHARTDVTPARRVPHDHGLPVRRGRVRDVPDRPGVERAHREVRARRRGLRDLVRQVDARQHRARHRRAAPRSAAHLQDLSAGGEADAARDRIRQ